MLCQLHMGEVLPVSCSLTGQLNDTIRQQMRFVPAVPTCMYSRLYVRYHGTLGVISGEVAEQDAAPETICTPCNGWAWPLEGPHHCRQRALDKRTPQRGPPHFQALLRSCIGVPYVCHLFLEVKVDVCWNDLHHAKPSLNSWLACKTLPMGRQALPHLK